MEKMKLYIAHPFDSRYKIKQWQESLNIENVEFINPFYNQKSVEIFNDVDKTSNDYYKKVKNWKKIVETDIAFIKESDGIVAIIDVSLSYGTIMEIAYAKFYNKKIYLIITNNQEEHIWFKYHADVIFINFNDFTEYIKNESNN